MIALEKKSSTFGDFLEISFARAFLLSSREREEEEEEEDQVVEIENRYNFMV